MIPATDTPTPTSPIAETPSSTARAKDVSGAKRQLNLASLARQTGAFLWLVLLYLWLNLPYLWLILPYLLAWAVPFVWCLPQWADSNHPQVIQPWIPVLAFILIASRRKHLHALLRAVEKIPPKTWLERGNSALLILGCLLYLFAHLVQIKGIAVIALLLIAVGAVHALFGGRMIKSLWIPIVFSLLIIPPPDSAVDWVLLKFRTISVKVAGVILNALHTGNKTTGWTVTFSPSGDVLEYPIPAGGLGVIVPSIILTLWWTLLWRQKAITCLVLPVLSGVIALILNILRVTATGFFAVRSPKITEILLQLNSWILVAITLVLVFLASKALSALVAWSKKKRGAKALRNSGALFSRAGKVFNAITIPFDYLFQGIGYLSKQTRRAGSVINLIVVPFDYLFRGIGYLFTLFGRSEQLIEKGLKRLFPKKRSRRR
jgi:hypothetical protein